MVTEEQAEELAFAAVNNYMQQCGITSLEDAKKAAAKIVGVAMGLLATVSDPTVQVQRLQ